MTTKDWFKDRGYPHFSNRTPLSVIKECELYVSNKSKVAKHSFLPLIFKEIKQRRYKKSFIKGIVRRSHKSQKNNKIVSNAKIRKILYASHLDSHIFSYFSQKIITPKYEEILEKNIHLSSSITGYRQIPTADNLKFKNNVHFAKDVFDEVKKRGNCVVLGYDIENFFPSLNHRLLKLAWARIIGCKSLPKDHYNIFKAATNFSYVKLNDLKTCKNHFDEKKLAKYKKLGKNTFFENINELIDSNIIIYKNQQHKDGKLIGIPQGLPISALLANIYMLQFDEAIISELTEKSNIYYRRYSDDIIFICLANEVEKVEEFVKEQIEKIKLIISFEKTEKTLFKFDNNTLQSYKIEGNNLIKNIPLNYLGFEFYGSKTLVKSKSLAGFYRRMKNTVKTKHNRVLNIKQDRLLDYAPIYKRKIYRLYSFKGTKNRELPASRITYKNEKIIVKKTTKKYRGNYIKYIYRASDEMKAPEIKRQIRNHWKILQKTISKYKFSNGKE
ncbi:reverse transcriptase domain-containing protein [Flavobacterium chungbukense]|uniref:Reverse transcriptase/maturase family protein n=1 Tax=Flavobacterium chungbukense TaxID=877464 RepID=A0ABP7XUI8_9FLAO|nr:reverse transcriptase domain-containing protein [Flavobacterium chungbukense]MCC4921363.1 RNA-directed DNA polymerase (Reverse transcriptase) [Flavobacterium chungbukense]